MSETCIDDFAASSLDLWIAEIALWYDEMDCLAAARSDYPTIVSRSPADGIDSTRGGQLDSPQFLACQSLPHPDGAIIATGSNVPPITINRNTSDSALMTLIRRCTSTWKWLQLLGIWQLRQQALRVDVQLAPPHSRCKVQVKTSLKPLIYEATIARYSSQSCVIFR